MKAGSHAHFTTLPLALALSVSLFGGANAQERRPLDVDDMFAIKQNSGQLYQALRRLGVPTQLVVYPGQSHGLRPPSYQKDRYVRYLEWYDKWVKPAEKPITDGS